MALVVGLVRYRKRRISLPGADETKTIDRSGVQGVIEEIQLQPRGDTDRRTHRHRGLPAVGDDATIPRDA